MNVFSKILAWVLTISFFVIASDISDVGKEKSYFPSTLNYPSSSKNQTLNNEYNTAVYGYPVSPDKYVLGPGDLIGIDVIGKTYQNFECNINPQGGIVLSEIGFIKASGKTISSFGEYLKLCISKKLKFDSIKVYLIKAKNVRITITGAVKKPGIYTLKSPARVSDTRKCAEVLPWGCMDSIIIKTDSSLKVVNLLSFFRNGDINNNPIIPTGAVIFYPSSVNNGKSIFLKTDKYFMPLAVSASTKISDLSLIFPSGFKSVNDVSIIVKRDGGNKVLIGYDDLKLLFGDTVTVYTKGSKVYVVGMVASPGDYNYSPSLTVRQYISMAGGVMQNGSLSRTKIFRNGKRIKFKNNSSVMPGDVIQIPPRILSQFSEYLGIISGIVSIVMAGKLANLY